MQGEGGRDAAGGRRGMGGVVLPLRVTEELPQGDLIGDLEMGETGDDVERVCAKVLSFVGRKTEFAVDFVRKKVSS